MSAFVQQVKLPRSRVDHYPQGLRGPFVASPLATARLGQRVFVSRAAYLNRVREDYDPHGRHHPAVVAARVEERKAAAALERSARYRQAVWDGEDPETPVHVEHRVEIRKRRVRTRAKTQAGRGVRRCVRTPVEEQEIRWDITAFMPPPVESHQKNQHEEAYIVYDSPGREIVKIEEEEVPIADAVKDAAPIPVKGEEDEAAVAAEAGIEADLCLMLSSLELDEEVGLCRMFSAITLQERPSGFAELPPLPRGVLVADALPGDYAMVVDESEDEGAICVNEDEAAPDLIIKSEDENDAVILSDIHSPRPLLRSELAISAFAAPIEVKTECVVVLDDSEEDTQAAYADSSIRPCVSVQDVVMGEPVQLLEAEQGHLSFSPHLHGTSSECRVKLEHAGTPKPLTDVEVISSPMLVLTQRFRDVDPENVVEVEACIKGELPPVDSVVSYADYLVVIPEGGPRMIEDVEEYIEEVEDEVFEPKGIEDLPFAALSHGSDASAELGPMTYVSSNDCDLSMADCTFETWFDAEMMELVEKVSLLALSDSGTTLASASSFALLKAFASSTQSSRHQGSFSGRPTPCTSPSVSSDDETSASSAPHTPEFASNFAHTHFPELVYHDVSISSACFFRPDLIPQLHQGVEEPTDTHEVCNLSPLASATTADYPAYESTASIYADCVCLVCGDEEQPSFSSHSSFNALSKGGVDSVANEAAENCSIDPFEHVWHYALSLPPSAKAPIRDRDHSQPDHVRQERPCSLPKWRDNTTLEVDHGFASLEWEENPLEDVWNYAWAQDFFDKALNDARDKSDAHPKSQPRHPDSQKCQKDPFEDVWHFARAEAFIELALTKIRSRYEPQYDLSPNANEPDFDDEALRTPSTINLSSPGPYPEPLMRIARESFWTHWTRPSDADLASIFECSDDTPAGLLIFSAEGFIPASAPGNELGTASKTVEVRVRLKQELRDSFFEHWERSLEALEL
ncbi:hypothetical protein C8Q79DRAFT_1008112 [Trametes meyenii]|nr:hypothetical protein C8Q79DRAFT_1008112 [Trametes meyenii]